MKSNQVSPFNSRNSSLSRGRAWTRAPPVPSGVGSIDNSTRAANRLSMSRSARKATTDSLRCPASNRKSSKPRRRVSPSKVSRKGAPPTSSRGLGVVLVFSPSLVPRPPTRIAHWLPNPAAPAYAPCPTQDGVVQPSSPINVLWAALVWPPASSIRSRRRRRPCGPIVNARNVTRASATGERPHAEDCVVHGLLLAPVPLQCGISGLVAVGNADPYGPSARASLNICRPTRQDKETR